MWGLEFSPDGTKLYASQWFGSNNGITQFDIVSNNLSQIQASATVIGSVTPNSGYAAGFMQRGYDNKIYIAKWNQSSLAVINYPDNAGMLCNFSNNGPNLVSGLSQAGLSQVVASECLATGISEIENRSSFSLYPNPNNGEFEIRSNRILNDKTEVFVKNILGETIYENSFKNFQGTFKIKLPVNLELGLYLVELKKENSLWVEKLLIK